MLRVRLSETGHALLVETNVQQMLANSYLRSSMSSTKRVRVIHERSDAHRKAAWLHSVQGRLNSTAGRSAANKKFLFAALLLVVGVENIFVNLLSAETRRCLLQMYCARTT